MAFNGLRTFARELVGTEGAARSSARSQLDAGRGAAVRSEGHAHANRVMFDRIAPTYDALNKVMSFGIDKRWRSRAVDALASERGPVLDLCAGTLDLAALLEKKRPGEGVVACDASAEMLDRGRAKVKRAEIIVGDALALPFPDDSFAGVICGFGMRNLADLARGIREAKRVLRPGGIFVTLELFSPRRLATRTLHRVGLRTGLPVLGAVIAGDREAYAYLAESMGRFVSREGYEKLLRQEGFVDVTSGDLTLGVAALVSARVPQACA